MHSPLTLVKTGQTLGCDNQATGRCNGFKGWYEITRKLPEAVTDNPQICDMLVHFPQRAVARRFLDDEMMFGYQIPSGLLMPNGSPGGGRNAGEGVGSS